MINKKNGEIEFKEFKKEENEVWRILCENQLKNLDGRVSHIWKEGWRLLDMDAKKIPDFIEVNKKLKKLTGWEIVMTDIEYEDSALWISSLAQKKHRITNFIRDKKNLDYTPLPDIFHDVFGHIPFLANPQYARIIEKFGKAMLNATTEAKRQKIISLGWYAYEFGFIIEKGKMKAFGTGLISSVGELKNALSSTVKKTPYNSNVVEQVRVSAHQFHKQLFILENLDQLEKVADECLK